MDEAVKLFDINNMKGVQAKFDLVKLTWMNGEYIAAKKDEELLRVVACIRKALPETNWREINNGSRWFRERSDLFVLNNVLYHSKTRLVVPQQLKPQILSLHHDSPFAGHRGSETMFKAVSHRYY